VQLSGGQHHLGVVQATLDSGAEYIASTGMDSMAGIWSVSSGQLLRKLEPMDAGEAWAVAFSPNAARVATAGQSGAVTIWETSSGVKQPLTLTPPAAKFALSLQFNGDGKQLACSAQDGLVCVFDVEHGALVRSLEGHSMAVRSVCFIPHTSLLVTGSDDMHLKLFDSRASQAVASLQGHLSWVLSVAVSPDGTRLASGSADRTVKVWDINTRQMIHTFGQHDDAVWAVAFEDSGQRLASAGDDCALITYQLSSGAENTNKKQP